MSESRADEDRVSAIEEEIAELKRRLPAHSVPPAMLRQLEELEIELEQTRAAHEGTDATTDER